MDGDNKTEIDLESFIDCFQILSMNASPYTLDFLLSGRAHSFYFGWWGIYSDQSPG